MSKEEILAEIADEEMRAFLEMRMDKGYVPEISKAVVGKIPEGDIHRWSKKISSVAPAGGTVSYVDENSLWLDLMRITWSAGVSDAETLSTLKNYSTVSLYHYVFNPSYIAFPDAAYVACIRKISEISIHKAAEEGKDAEDYTAFVDAVLKGKSAIDIAIEKGKNETAKALLSLNHIVPTDDGPKEVPHLLLSSSWLPKATDTKNKALYNMAVAGGEKEVNSKFAVAALCHNYNITKFILTAGYKLNPKDIHDIYIAEHESNCQDFLSSLSDLRADIKEPIIKQFADLGVDVAAVLGEVMEEA